jgi:hypothetical protein
LAIREWLPPTNLSQVRSFLVLAGFYRRFVKDFSTIADPINELTKKRTTFHWGETQERAFQELKMKLTTAPLPIAYFSEKLSDPTLNYSIYDK